MTALSVGTVELVALGEIVMGSGDAVIAKTSEGVITFWSRGAATVYGYTEDEVVGRHVEMLIPAQHRAEERQRHQRVAAGAVESGVRCVRLGRGGRRLDLVTSMSPVRDPGGRIVGIASISRPASQGELFDARFASVLEAAPDAMVCLDAGGRIEFVNRQVRVLFGYPPEELIGQSVDVLVPEGVRAGHARHRADFLRDPQARSMGSGLSLRARKRDGSTFPAEISLAADRTDGAVLVIAAIRDVTVQRATEVAARDAESAARAANEAKNQFLSRMSHELRTPLNAVLGFGQLLDRQLAGTPYSQQIGHIIKGGRHLLDLINDVLDIARIESGELTLSTEPVPIADVVCQTLELMRPIGDAAGVTLALVSSEVDQFVLADRQRLRQILLNLLSNAVKYNREGGHVWVGWQRREGMVALTVRDDGPGIPEALHSRLFTPFDRLGAEASGVEGTGIGLALTRSLAEVLGGSITVDAPPGEGACFTVTLVWTEPPAAPNAAELAAASAGAAAITARPSTVLYIEDNAPNVLVLEHLLQLRTHWRLIHAATSGLGLELANAHHPELILLDLHLPGMSGRDVLLELKTHPELSSIPVIVLTADASAVQKRRLMNEGAAGFFTKPFEIDDVLRVLDAVSESVALAD